MLTMKPIPQIDGYYWVKTQRYAGGLPNHTMWEIVEISGGRVGVIGDDQWETKYPALEWVGPIEVPQVEGQS